MRSFVGILALLSACFCAAAADKEIVLIAGSPSHPPGEHEHNAGVLALQKWLKTVKGVHTTVTLSGAWPENDALEKAAEIFVFCDGSAGHVVFKSEDHVAAIAKAAARGAGLMFYHYATEPPADKGHEEMLEWIGGFFELNYSVNPLWDADFQSLPVHPITRGVKPFHIRDEWYFNMRFAEKPRGVTSILVATPPQEASTQRDGIRSGNPDVRSKVGQPQVVVWAKERTGGGRSVGFTGGHYHKNLGDENFRKLMLNAILWTAKVNVPAKGVQVTLGDTDLTDNLDPKAGRGGRGRGVPPAPPGKQ